MLPTSHCSQFMTPDRGPLYQVNLPTELLSRGSGEQIPAREATAFDVMPQALGGMFMTDPELRKRIHFWGDHIAIPFIGLKETYQKYATRLLARGDVNGALDAYKRSLHNQLEYSSGIAGMQHLWLLNSDEVEKLDVGDRKGNRFSPLELQLLQAIGTQDSSFDPEAYTEFIREIRHLEKRSRELNRLFWTQRRFDQLNKFEKPGSLPEEKEVGEEYVEVLSKMGRFKQVVNVVVVMGDQEAQVKYKELAKTQPEDSKELQSIIEQARNDYDPDRFRW